MWEANKRGLAIISTCCLRSSADSSSSSKRPLILPMLNPARVLASFTDTSLLRVVICPSLAGFRLPQAATSPPAHEGWFRSSTRYGRPAPPGRPADPSPAPRPSNAGRCRASSRISSRLVRLSAIRCPLALSSFPPLFSQLLSVGKVQGHAPPAAGQVLQAFLLFGFRCA